jgi:O-antigen/teichoic acid export membrane protein
MTSGGMSDIGSRIVSGVAWKAGSQITLQISRMVVALILARLLAPHDWGLAAMVMVVSGFVVVFTDSALATALIQRRKLFDEDKSTVFWLSGAIGLVLAVGGIALSGPLASFYREPKVQPMFIALSIGFLVTALGAPQAALLAREMQFRRLELRQIAATIVGAVTGITVALQGYGAWAIVGQALAEASASTVLLWYLTPWRPSLVVSGASIRRLGGFAGNVFGENLLYQIGRNLPGVVIGRVLGAAALGAFVLATNVILVPFSRIAGPLQQVFFPAFTRMRDDRERMADIWIRASRLVGVISFPALVGLVIVASDFVDVVLGSRWASATPVIQIMACVGLLTSLQTLNGEVLFALDRAGTFLRFTILWFVGTTAALAVGLHWGIVGVAACYAFASLLLEPIRAYITTSALGISLWRFVGSFSGVAQATAVMAACLLALRAALVAAETPAAVRLAVLVAAGVAVYVVACLWRAPEVAGEIRKVRRRTKPAPTPRPEPIEAQF